ncbi:cytidylate kinase-like family protein [Lachnospiraceae bacterium 62-35]
MEGKKVIISIGRQYGSGGAEIGSRLAKELGVDCYDKNILRMNSDESGIKESYFHLADEKAGGRLLYKIISSMVPEKKGPSFGADLVSADNLFRFQSEVIRKLAAEESFVIIGRCADYVLEGDKGLARVFLYADMESRMERLVGRGICSREEAPRLIKRMDRERRDYYRYYTGKSWSSIDNYDILLNTAKLGVEGTVQAIQNYLELRGLKV